MCSSSRCRSSRQGSALFSDGCSRTLLKDSINQSGGDTWCPPSPEALRTGSRIRGESPLPWAEDSAVPARIALSLSALAAVASFFCVVVSDFSGTCRQAHLTSFLRVFRVTQLKRRFPQATASRSAVQPNSNERDGDRHGRIFCVARTRLAAEHKKSPHCPRKMGGLQPVSFSGMYRKYGFYEFYKYVLSNGSPGSGGYPGARITAGYRNDARRQPNQRHFRRRKRRRN
jgi:hypothetical protein